jgi:hypothetical protein
MKRSQAPSQKLGRSFSSSVSNQTFSSIKREHEQISDNNISDEDLTSKRAKQEVILTTNTNSIPNIKVINNNNNNNNNNGNDGAHYFTVLHCKLSKKKHKSYDDGVLVVRNNQCVLLTTTGQVLGKTAMYSSKTLNSLNVGNTLICSGRELEITGIVPAADYLSGRVFISGLSQTNSSLSSSNVNISPALSRSLHNNNTTLPRSIPSSTSNSTSTSPLLSPPPDAIILHPVEARAGSSSSCSQTVPVFLDPILAR